MRMVEIRERYARRVPGRGMALLIWQADATPPTGQEALYPTLAQAQRAACTYLQDPRCTGVWLYDGRRLYDRAALTLWAQEAGAA